MKDGIINIFAAYDFNSKHYKKEDLEKAIRGAVKNVQKDVRSKFKGLTLQLIEQKDIESLEYVGEFIRNSLENAVITVFELSDRNPNVTFELGYSLGMAKYRFEQSNGYDVIIQNDKVDPKNTMSDLLGRFIVTYKYNLEAAKTEEYKKIQKKIENELKRKINSLLEDNRILKRLVWRIYREDVNVICPYIPPEDQERYGIRSSLAEYGDFNTVYEICVFLKGILNCNVKYYHSKAAKSVRDLFDNNLVIIGGPMWNKYATEVMEDYNLPYKYVWTPEETVEDYLINHITNKEYHTSKRRQNGENITISDFGIFAVLPNRFNKDKVIILINGITSVGGLGAARAFTEGETSSQNCKLLLTEVGFKDYFVGVVESDVRWGEFPYPKKIERSEIFTYIEKENRWRYCERTL